MRNVLLGGFVLATVGMFLWLLVNTETEVEAQSGCPNPRLIDEITGSGDQESPPFNSTTDLLRISYDVQAERDTVPLLLSVRDADDADAPSVGDATTSGTDSDQTFVNAPPGRYFLEIGTTDAQYTIQVEECGEGGEASPGEGKSGEGTSSPKTTPTPKTPATPPKTPSSPTPKSPSPPPPPPPSNGSLMKAGGPETGPLPVMPNGSCPQEFPERRGNACYA